MFLTFSYLAKRDCAAPGAVPRGDVWSRGARCGAL